MYIFDQQYTAVPFYTRIGFSITRFGSEIACRMLYDTNSFVTKAPDCRALSSVWLLQNMNSVIIGVNLLGNFQRFDACHLKL